MSRDSESRDFSCSLFLGGKFKATVFVYITTCWVLVAIAVASFGPLTKGRTLA